MNNLPAMKDCPDCRHDGAVTECCEAHWAEVEAELHRMHGDPAVGCRFCEPA